MTALTAAQWDALAEAFAGGPAPVPPGAWSVNDIVEASKRGRNPVQRTTASILVRRALQHGLIECVREGAGPRPALYVFADGTAPGDVAAVLAKLAKGDA